MNVQRPTVWELFRYFVRLGATGFGGPIALVGYMERELVDQRHWVSSQEFNDGLAFSQLAPGPLAAQLAIYLGWLCGGARGATAAGVAFVGPSFAMVIALAALYVRFGGMSWLVGAFYGIGAAVIAIIARSVVKLARRSLSNDRLLWCLFLAMAFVTAWREDEVVWLFVLCGLITMAVKVRPTPRIALALAAWPGIGKALTLPIAATVFAYFASAGLFVFGSGLAIVPFLHDGVVRQYQWLTERQFLDAVAVALITPGPVVITVAFIGYLVAGVLGAVAAAAGVFAPVYIITLTLAPRYDQWKRDARIRAFVDGVTAAATGAIAGAAVVLGRRAIVDATTAMIAAASVLLLTMIRKLPEPLLVIAAGLTGIVIVELRS